jgi:hypothetical protein
MEAYNKLNKKQKSEFEFIFKKAEKLIGSGIKFTIKHKGITFKLQTIWDDGAVAKTYLNEVCSSDYIVGGILRDFVDHQKARDDIFDMFLHKNKVVLEKNKLVNEQIHDIYEQVDKWIKKHGIDPEFFEEYLTYQYPYNNVYVH